MKKTDGAERRIDDLWIVAPLLDDWEGCQRLASDLDVALGPIDPKTKLMLLIADDGSSTSLSDEAHRFPTLVRLRVSTTRTESTNGHQASIARALRGLADALGPGSLVVVMDSDGEDSPNDVARLVSHWKKSSASVITAERGKRSEPLAFRFFYRVYRLVFRLLTGELLANGNFSASQTRVGSATPASSRWSRPVRSMASLMSVCTTCPDLPTFFENASARSPVPPAMSSTLKPSRISATSTL